MFSRFFSIVLAAIVLSALSTSVRAEPILIDFNEYLTTPTLGGAWNEIASPSTTPQALVDSSGGSTSVTLATSGDFVDSVFSSAGWTKSWVDTNAVSDYFYLDTRTSAGGAPKSGEVTFSGLDDNLLYRVEVVACRSATTAIVPVDIKVQGLFTTHEVSSDDFNCHVDGYTNKAILVWNNVEPTSGQIALTFDVTTNDGLVFMNAARLAIVSLPVPEPMSLILCLTGLVFCGLARCRRRRR